MKANINIYCIQYFYRYYKLNYLNNFSQLTNNCNQIKYVIPRNLNFVLSFNRLQLELTIQLLNNLRALDSQIIYDLEFTKKLFFRTENNFFNDIYLTDWTKMTEINLATLLPACSKFPQLHPNIFLLLWLKQLMDLLIKKNLFLVHPSSTSLLPYACKITYSIKNKIMYTKLHTYYKPIQKMSTVLTNEIILNPMILDNLDNLNLDKEYTYLDIDEFTMPLDSKPSGFILPSFKAEIPEKNGRVCRPEPPSQLFHFKLNLNDLTQVYLIFQQAIKQNLKKDTLFCSALPLNYLNRYHGEIQSNFFKYSYLKDITIGDFDRYVPVTGKIDIDTINFFKIHPIIYSLATFSN